MPLNTSLDQFLNPRVWTGVVRGLPVDKSYQLAQFLPEREVPSDRVIFDILTDENPMAPFVAQDAASPRMDGELLQSAIADVLYIRVKRSLREHDLRVIRDLSNLDPNNITARSMAQAAASNIARQAERTNDAVEARLEWLRAQALMGAITYDGPTEGLGSNVKFTIQFPVVTASAVTTSWGDTTNADPLADIIRWFNENPRVNYTTMIAGREVFYALMRNAKLIRQMFAALGGGTDPTITSQNRVSEMFSAELGLRGINYNARYTSRTVTSPAALTLAEGRFIPSDKIIFVPDEAPGYFATSPSLHNNYQPGKFAWADVPGENRPIDPPIHEVGTGYYGLPILDRAFSVLVADVGTV